MDPDANVQLERRNLDHARDIWAGLCSSGYGVPDAFLHLWRIVELACYARLSPDPPAPSRPGEGKGKAKRQSHKNKAIYSCLSLAVTEDGDELRGASSTLRATMRYMQVDRHGPVGRYKETKDVWGGEGEGAFDEHNRPRLVKKLEAEYAATGEPMPPRPHAGHAYESCAEQVAFEKVSRLGKTPQFLYTVQKTARFDYVVGDPHPLINKYEVKVVHRCPNCMMFPGHLGHVVTDSEPLGGLHVPVVTPSVLKFFRDQVDQHSNINFLHSSKITTVWLHLPNFGSINVVDRVLLRRIGPNGIELDEEISRATQCQDKCKNK